LTVPVTVGRGVCLVGSGAPIHCATDFLSAELLVSGSPFSSFELAVFFRFAVAAAFVDAVGSCTSDMVGTSFASLGFDGGAFAAMAIGLLGTTGAAGATTRVPVVSF